MITQEISVTCLMEPMKALIIREGDFGNQIKLNLPSLDGITSAEFRMIKPDGTVVIVPCELYENSTIVTVTSNMTDLTGKGIFNLKLINDHSNIYTYIGRILIDTNLKIEEGE